MGLKVDEAINFKKLDEFASYSYHVRFSLDTSAFRLFEPMGRLGFWWFLPRFPPKLLFSHPDNKMYK